MEFDWDAANIIHLWERHRLLPAQVEEAMGNGAREYGAKDVDGERRIIFVGSTNAGLVLLIVTTPRNGKIRVVTARPASRVERKFFTAPLGGEE